MVLKALEAIKEAENKAAAIKESIATQMKEYETQKNSELLEKTQLAADEIAQKLEDVHNQLHADYEEKKASAKAQATQEIEEMNQHFAENKEELVSFIVEKVRENYGS